MQILVLGMHRAGTSITTRLINLMGAYFAPEGMALEACDQNPKGFWERLDVVQVNDAILKHQGCQWHKVDSWKNNRVVMTSDYCIQKIRTIVMNMDAFRPWVLKDPRLCMTLPCWLPDLEVPVAVIASRDPWEIALSLQSRDGQPIHYAMAIWEYYAVSVIRHAHLLPKVFSRHDEMLREPLVAVQKLYEDLKKLDVTGLRMPTAREIVSFIEPKLHRAKRKADAPTLSSHHATLNAMLRGDIDFDPRLQMSKRAIEIMRNEHYESSCKQCH